jgi:hypothetical protein
MHDWQWICADDTHAIAPWQQAGALAFAPAGLRDALQDLRWICMAFLSKPSQ